MTRSAIGLAAILLVVGVQWIYLIELHGDASGWAAKVTGGVLLGVFAAMIASIHGPRALLTTSRGWGFVSAMFVLHWLIWHRFLMPHVHIEQMLLHANGRNGGVVLIALFLPEGLVLYWLAAAMSDAPQKSTPASRGGRHRSALLGGIFCLCVALLGYDSDHKNLFIYGGWTLWDALILAGYGGLLSAVILLHRE